MTINASFCDFKRGENQNQKGMQKGSEDSPSFYTFISIILQFEPN